jgi:hypothetical protein
VAGNARLLGLLLVLCLSAATPALAARQATTFSPLLEHWDGTAWTQVPGSGQGNLTAVAAVSSSDVWAFGLEKSRVLLAEHWDGTTWQQVDMPTPPGVHEVDLWSASATSATSVWVAGAWCGRGTNRNFRTLVERWDGRSWKIVRTPSPGRDALVFGIAALSPSDVWAVGEWQKQEGRNRDFRTLALYWNGKRWSRAAVPSPGSYDQLRGIFALGRRNLWAVGNQFDERARRRGERTLVVHWNGKAWRSVPSPSPGGARREDGLFGVGGADPETLWAVGEAGSIGAGEPLVEHWDGTAWRTQRAAPPAQGSLGGLSGVAAFAADDAWVAGSYVDPYLGFQALAEHWNGSTWSVVPTPSAGSQSSFEALAAVSSTDIWAVGYSESP